jgi:hypothetical protein
MKRSTERILTTFVGSLARPADLLEIRHYAAVLRRSSAERAMVRPWKLRSRLSL